MKPAPDIVLPLAQPEATSGQVEPSPRSVANRTAVLVGNPNLGKSVLRGLLRRKTVERTEHAANVATLQDLKPGQRARVVCLGTQRTSRHDTLAVFGLELGAEVTLVQRRPACVVQVDETTLALDVNIAREILVEPAVPTSNSQ